MQSDKLILTPDPAMILAKTRLQKSPYKQLLK